MLAPETHVQRKIRYKLLQMKVFPRSASSNSALSTVLPDSKTRAHISICVFRNSVSLLAGVRVPTTINSDRCHQEKTASAMDYRG